MSVPLAWQRIIELADAHLRMAQNSQLQWGADEDPDAVIPHLLETGLFEHRLNDRRILYLNGGTDPETIPAPNPGGESWMMALEPGQAKILFRNYLDGVFTPGCAYSIFSTGDQITRLLELELDRIGYRYESQ